MIVSFRATWESVKYGSPSVRLHRPVDEQRDADAFPVRSHLAERAEVDLHQHGDDHHPDEQPDRDVDAGDFHAADRLEKRW
jgi:hypothetical protein